MNSQSVSTLIRDMFEEFVKHLAANDDHHEQLLRATKHYLLKGFVPDSLRQCRCSRELTENCYKPPPDFTEEQKEEGRKLFEKFVNNPRGK